MANKKSDLTGMKDSKLMKSIGVTEMKQNGGRVELMIDPSKLSPERRRNLGAGLAALSKASAGSMGSNPFAPNLSNHDSYATKMNIHQKMQLANAWYDKDPLVGKTIELMKTLACEDFKNECSDPKIKKFYDEWYDRVDMDMVLGWIFLEYFRTGNVPIMRELVPYNKKEFGFPETPPYSTGGGELDSAEAAKKNDYSKKMIPGAYTVINPLFVVVDTINPYGDSLSMNLDRNQKFELTDPNEVHSIMVRRMPSDLKERAVKESRVPLSQDKVKRILRMRQPYEPYGKIIMERAFDALYLKAKMREMDLAMINSVISQVVKVTIGNDAYPATQAQLKKLAEAWQNVGKSQMIFWNHTLEVEIITPKQDILNQSKYSTVDNDIRDAFGLSAILTNNGASAQHANFATSYLSLKVFIANLKEARKDVLRWMRGEYEDIAKAMGFKEYPNPMFGQLTLTDETSEKQIIMQLVDRGIISYETAQSRLGYDSQVEIDRRTREKPLRDNGVLGIVGNPFQQPGGGGGAGTKDKPVKTQTKQGQDPKEPRAGESPNGLGKSPGPPKSGMEGRPQTPKGNYPKTRKTAKMKGQAELFDGEEEGLEELEDDINQE